MGQNIAKCRYVSPRNLGVVGLQQDQIRILETLTNDFKIP